MLHHNNAFIRLFLHLYWQFHHTYVHSKGSKSIFYFIHKFLYIITIFFQSVFFPLLFIVMFFTLILLLILNSKFWFRLILIFDFYNLNYNIIIEIQIFIIDFSSWLLLVIHSRWKFPRKMASYHRHHCWLLLLFVFICFLLGITDYIISTLLIDHIIAIYHYFIQDSYHIDRVVSHSLEILFQRNGAISPSPWFIVIFCTVSLFPPRGWVQQLVGINDYIGSTFIRGHIIDIYQYFIQYPYQLNCAASHSIAI